MAIFQMDYFSKSLDRHAEVYVLIPNDMQQDNEHYKRPTKTLYLFHGYTGTANDWLVGSSITELSMMYNLAVVMPSGENSFYLNGKGKGRAFETYVGVELPNYIQKTFGLSAKKEDNFVGGLSMGGFGAIHTGLKYPETFGKIVGLSSALIIHNIKNITEEFTDHIADYDYYHMVFGDLSKLEQTDKNPEVLVKQCLENNNLPAIYMACGTEDFLLNENRTFANYLTENDVNFTYLESPGIHNWTFWNGYLESSIQWLLQD